MRGWARSDSFYQSWWCGRNRPTDTWWWTEYLHAHPTLQIGTPAPSSWGQLGYSQVWLNETNDWIYPHLHWSTGRMIELARELMRAQSSDWAFIMVSKS